MKENFSLDEWSKKHRQFHGIGVVRGNPVLDLEEIKPMPYQSEYLERIQSADRMVVNKGRERKMVFLPTLQKQKEFSKSLSAIHIKAERELQKIRKDWMKQIMDKIYDEFILMYAMKKEMKKEMKKDFDEAERILERGIDTAKEFWDVDMIDISREILKIGLFNYETRCMELMGAH